MDKGVGHGDAALPPDLVGTGGAEDVLVAQAQGGLNDSKEGLGITAQVVGFPGRHRAAQPRLGSGSFAGTGGEESRPLGEFGGNVGQQHPGAGRTSRSAGTRGRRLSASSKHGSGCPQSSKVRRRVPLPRLGEQVGFEQASSGQRHQVEGCRAGTSAPSVMCELHCWHDPSLVQCPCEQPTAGSPVEAQVEDTSAEVPSRACLHPPELALAVGSRTGGCRTGDAPPTASLHPVGVDIADQVEPPAPQELGRGGISTLNVNGLGIDTHCGTSLGSSAGQSRRGKTAWTWRAPGGLGASPRRTRPAKSRRSHGARGRVQRRAMIDIRLLVSRREQLTRYVRTTVRTSTTVNLGSDRIVNGGFGPGG